MRAKAQRQSFGQSFGEMLSFIGPLVFAMAVLDDTDLSFWVRLPATLAIALPLTALSTVARALWLRRRSRSDSE